MITKRTIVFTSLALLTLATILFRTPIASRQGDGTQYRAVASQEQTSDSAKFIPGLRKQTTVVRDKFGVPHIAASNDQDAYFMMGYFHAQDRFFQMDVMRRQGRGALAELLGVGPNDQILGSDVLNRNLGIGRAAARSLSAYSQEALALIQAYSNGVNAWLDRNSLPPEYSALELTQTPKWTTLDSIIVVKFIQFQLSFDTADLDRTLILLNFQAAGRARGFDGAKLFFDDLFTFTPFDPVVTGPRQVDAALHASQESRALDLRSELIENARRAEEMIHPETLEAARKFVEQYDQNPLLNRSELGIGSNWWVVARSKTDSGNAMLASDPHLGLGTPSTFYEIHLTVDSHSSPMNVYGVSYPGAPGVFLGENPYISWGATTSGIDVTDFYAERLTIENGVPVATNYKGQIEPLEIIPEEFRINQIQNGAQNDTIVVSPGARPSGLGVPPAILVAPRRNNGALIAGGPTGGFSVQYTGASATRELEGVFALARARNLTDFKKGLQLMEVGSLNWAYADIDGNIASFSAGKIPLREDLQAGIVDGLPPFFLRDGTGAVKNEWIPKSENTTGFNYESLPFDEMPQEINPAQGFLVNANNDPIGVTLDNNPLNEMRAEGIYYISSGFNPGFRAAKITRLLTQQLTSDRGPRKVSFKDMKRIQSNVQMFDAEVFTPYIIRAFDSARSSTAPAELAAFANDSAISEAISRLSNWDFSAPTGISEGYDAADRGGDLQPPSDQEVSHSIAATIYTVWRSQILANTIVATLQRNGVGGGLPDGARMLVDLKLLLEKFSVNRGVGASGIDFFAVPGVVAPAEARRDGVILKSLKDSLNLLGGDAFAAAFGRTTSQQEYRWGRLHRITFRHNFGGLAPQFSVPVAGNFVDLSPALPGLAADGGFETIDNGPFNVRAASSQAYVFGGGAARRYIGELRRGGHRSEQIIPGGQIGVIGDKFHSNQLSLWLTNDYHPIFFSWDEINRNRYSKTVYRPSR